MIEEIQAQRVRLDLQDHLVPPVLSVQLEELEGEESLVQKDPLALQVLLENEDS